MRWYNMLGWTGDVARARSILETVPQGRRAEMAWDYYQQCMLERDPAGAIEALKAAPDRIDFFYGRGLFVPDLLEGFAYRMMGDLALAAKWFDSARVQCGRMLAEGGHDMIVESEIRNCLGMAYAGLGRREEAIDEGQKAGELVSRDRLNTVNNMIDLVMIYALVGEYDKALDGIEYLLSTNSFISVPFLEVSWRVDPLRDLPRYKRIIGKYSSRSGV
jgi:tetratricopeptide (TPR) repeat protein